MTLDESPITAHNLLRRDTDRERDLDAGSEAAEEAMFREGLARLRASRPWRFVDPDPQVSVDARCYQSAGTDEVECWRHPQEPEDAA